MPPPVFLAQVFSPHVLTLTNGCPSSWPSLFSPWRVVCFMRHKRGAIEAFMLYGDCVLAYNGWVLAG